MLEFVTLTIRSASGAKSPIYGHEDTSKYPAKTLTLAPGEVISNAELFGDGKGTLLVIIHIETPKQTFDAGADTSGHNPYQINVGSGLLFGGNIVTRQSDEGLGDDVASLAFLFLGQALDHISIGNIQFDSDPSGSNSGIFPQNIVVGQWYNDQASNSATYSLAPTYTVADSYTYSQSVTTSFGESISIEVSGELFGIGAKSTNEFTWGVSVEQATTVGTTSSTAIACAASGTLAPSTGVKVSGAYQTGTGTFKYTSTVTVYLKDGSSFSYQEHGTLTNIAYNGCTTTFADDNDPSISNSPGFEVLGPAKFKRAPAPTPKPKMPVL